MTKETSSSDSSLPLHEVLEAEFVGLHGELPSDYPGSSEPKTRLKALYDAIHGLKEKRAALCISGGGIRSATFGLGILQGLARCGLLEKFHFLSTVSGGGYIGSWLSAWIKNDPEIIPGSNQPAAELACLGSRHGPHKIHADGGPDKTRLGYLAQHPARNWKRVGRYSDGLCNHRCSFYWQCAIATTPVSGIPAASIDARISRFGRMVGFAPQRSRQRAVSSQPVVAQICGVFRRELFNRRHSCGRDSLVS